MNIVAANDWSIKDMKQMEDGTSAMYKRAIEAGISDGFARGFRGELRRFKQSYRHTRNERRAAIALGQMGGIYCLPFLILLCQCYLCFPPHIAR